MLYEQKERKKMTTETKIFTNSDGTTKEVALSREQWRTVEIGKNGKPTIMMKLSAELVSTAPQKKAEREQ